MINRKPIIGSFWLSKRKLHHLIYNSFQGNIKLQQKICVWSVLALPSLIITTYSLSATRQLQRNWNSSSFLLFKRILNVEGRDEKVKLHTITMYKALTLFFFGRLLCLSLLVMLCSQDGFYHFSKVLVQLKLNGCK